MLAQATQIGLAFAVPQFLETLSRPLSPSEAEVQNPAMKKMREVISTLAVNSAGVLSMKTRFIVWDVLAKNAWVSFLALMVLKSGAGKNITVPLGPQVVFFVSMCSTSWLMRMGVNALLQRRSDRSSRFISPGGMPKIAQPAPTIPKEFHNDPVLSQYICPITQNPIRKVVIDPKNNRYEKKAIQVFVGKFGTSPVDGQLLTLSQLKDEPAIQAIIDQRLKTLNVGVEGV